MQQPPVSVRIAPDAVGAFPGEALAGAPFGAFHRLPDPLLGRQEESPREHSCDPLALRLHHRQQSTRRVHEPCEEDPNEVGRDDPPVQREVPTVRGHQ
jgi:hypothetical protein